MDLHPEELLDAEVTGAMTDADRERLDAHCRVCAPCAVLRAAQQDFARETVPTARDEAVARAVLAVFEERAKVAVPIRPIARSSSASWGMLRVAAVLAVIAVAGSAGAMGLAKLGRSHQATSRFRPGLAGAGLAGHPAPAREQRAGARAARVYGLSGAQSQRSPGGRSAGRPCDGAGAPETSGARTAAGLAGYTRTAPGLDPRGSSPAPSRGTSLIRTLLADIDLADTRYVVELAPGRGTVADPWRLRPGLQLAFGFRNN